MSDKKIKSMVMAAVMAALTYVATTVIKIPAPTGGYVHIGDGLVLLCGWILGPWWGGAAAGIGSMLVDLLGGYMSFVPGTLIIKFLDAMAAALIVKALGRKTYSYVVGGLAGEAIMVAGYFVYEALALQLGMGAAAGVLANVGQGAVGLVIALVLHPTTTIWPLCRWAASASSCAAAAACCRTCASRSLFSTSCTIPAIVYPSFLCAAAAGQKPRRSRFFHRI